MDPLVIIGTGLAGYNLAKEFRKLDKGRPLIMITADDGRSYSKPMLSTGFTKGKEAHELVMADVPSMMEQLDAQIYVDTKVRSINPEEKTLELDDRCLTYGDLVLALGADVYRPTLDGDGVGEVLSVNDLVDYSGFRIAVKGKNKVVIIGGGLIGCEFANDLINGGYAVDVVEPLGRPLPGLLPEEASRAVQEGLEEIGVNFHFRSSVSAVNRSGDRLAVTLSDGQRLETDAVLSAIGLRPRVALAEAAGLETGRGVKANYRLETTEPGIYALGDCSEVEGRVMLYVLPLMAGVRALAKTLAGTPTEVDYGPMPVIIKTPACPVVVAPPLPAVEGRWEIESEGRNVKALFHDGQGRLRGFALTGDKVKEKNILAKQSIVDN